MLYIYGTLIFAVGDKVDGAPFLSKVDFDKISSLPPRALFTTIKCLIETEGTLLK